MQLAFDLLSDEQFDKENAASVMKELLTPCSSCRLSNLHPANRGMVYRGAIDAKVAIIGEAPRDTETERGSALIGIAGAELEKWMNFIGLDTRRAAFLTNIVQCQPPKKKIGGRMKQREPDKEEISACFGPRCLRVLRAMPNLECVITLGWTAAKAFLGTSNGEAEPKAKTHEGGWFESSLLPGVAIFCMPDPMEVLTADSDDKRMTVEYRLSDFKREYLQTRKVVDLARDAQTAREEAGLGMF